MATRNDERPKRMREMRQKVDPNDPEVRWDKVKKVLEALVNGTYPLDENVERVADSLVTRMS